MGIAVYRYSVELLTPTIITSALGYRGMSYTVVIDYIPGSMIRGALFTWLLLERLIGSRDVELEAREPKHSVSPALYKSRELERALPYHDIAFAHALSYAYKGDKRVFSLGIEKLLEEVERSNSIERALQSLVFEHIIRTDAIAYRNAYEDPLYVFRCSAEMRCVAGNTIARLGDGWVLIKASRGIYVENAIDRARGSAAQGALYAYEYIESGSRFTGTLSLEEGTALGDALKSVEGSCIVVRIGRGLGRGFGLARLCIEKLESRELEKLMNRVEVSKRIAIYVGAPFTVLSPIPRPPRAGDELEFKVFGKPVAKVIIEGIVGRTAMKYYGWSYRSGTPKLPIKALAPGALLIAKLEVRDPDLLSLISVTGIDNLSSQGFNFVRLLDRDFIAMG